MALEGAVLDFAALFLRIQMWFLLDRLGFVISGVPSVRKHWRGPKGYRKVFDGRFSSLGG